MPREARTKSESGYYHILLRGMSRQNIFEEDADRQRFISTLKRYKKELGFEIHAYCLMGNHVHLLLKDKKDELDLIMKKIAGSYAYYYNQKYDRIGHLFQDRYKSETVDDDEYYLTVLRYIHQNPVKAKITEIDKYKWSSYEEYIGQADIIDREFGLELLGGTRSYIEFMKAEETSKKNCLEMTETSRITDIKAKEILWEETGMSKFNEISQKEKAERNQILKELKRKGLTIKQLERLSGINRGIIQRA